MTSYLEALRQAAILFPIIAVAFTIPYIAFNYHKYGSILSLRAVIVYTFILYLLGGLAARFLPSRNEIDRASFVRGHQVSFLRRLVALVYDAVAAAVLSGVLILALAALSLPVHIASAGLLAMVYFMFVPVLSRGQTMGHRLTRLRVVTAEGERSRWYQYILRYGSLFAVLYWLPWLLNLAIIFLRDQGILNDLTALVAGGALVGGYLFCLLFEAVRMAVHKPLFYERLSRTRVVSTIPPEDPDEP